MNSHPDAGQAVQDPDGTSAAAEAGNGELLVFDPAVRFSDRLERMVGTAAREAAEGLAAAKVAAERMRSDAQREVAVLKAEAEGVVAARLGEAQAQATEVLTRAREQAQEILEDARVEAHALTSATKAQVAEERQRGQAQVDRMLATAQNEGELLVVEARDRARALEEQARVIVVEAQATRAVTLEEIQAHKRAVLADLADRTAAASEQAAALVAKAEAEAARIRQESAAEVEGLREQSDQVMKQLRALRRALASGAQEPGADLALERIQDADDETVADIPRADGGDSHMEEPGAHAPDDPETATGSVAEATTGSGTHQRDSSKEVA